MTWTPDEHRSVVNALLGSWPGAVAAWGREAIAAYVSELGARGLAAEQVLAAIRTWPAGSDFPPSAPNLAAAARRDPSRPTFDEALTLTRKALRAINLPLTGDYATEAQMLGARERNVLARANGMHPLVATFVARHGVRRLQDEVGELDGEYGAIRRQELERAWTEHCEANENRDVAALVAGRRGELGAFDPLAALQRAGAAPASPPTQLASGGGA